MIDFLKNTFLYRNKYKTNSEAVIVACYYNPTNNPFRLTAFNKFYESIKHLNHRIIECVIGDSTAQLPKSEFISTVYTDTTLWHKESLLNNLISKLPKKYKYVFWLDTDIIFTNKNWLNDAVNDLKKNNIVQLFEYCIHLDENLYEPNFNVEHEKTIMTHPKLWRSFAANYNTTNLSNNEDYKIHGHVGFAWGAKREILEMMPLYDKALVGGADHIIAHAAAGHINHKCISKSFTDDIDNVNEWSIEFSKLINGKLGFIKGDLYHIWHGDLNKRQYLKRIKDFTSSAKEINEKDENGLYVTHNDNYVKEYMSYRENTFNRKNAIDNYNIINNIFTHNSSIIENTIVNDIIVNDIIVEDIIVEDIIIDDIIIDDIIIDDNVIINDTIINDIIIEDQWFS